MCREQFSAHFLFLKIVINGLGVFVSFGYTDESFRYKILKIGDLARFKKLEDTIGIDFYHIDYIGLVLDRGKPCSDGEITYQVLCGDAIVRTFFDYEADESISSIS